MKEKSIDFVTPIKALGEAQEEDISSTVLEATKTLLKVASQVLKLILWYLLVKGVKVDGKDPMVEEIHFDELIANTECKRGKKHIRTTKEMKSSVHVEAQFYTNEDWDAIRR
ncbi:hypothetical protein Tco_0771859 [Tanacetum coccineum]|uniref:Uncharacterized protein n=1 Tax=Tanacetum coccineum TaxID=301880 RepID=A0ABQ4ZK12_9ASTR